MRATLPSTRRTAYVGATKERCSYACDPQAIAAGLVGDARRRASRGAGRKHPSRPASKIASPDRSVDHRADEERRPRSALDPFREEPVGQVDACREVAAVPGRGRADGRRAGEENEQADQRKQTFSSNAVAARRGSSCVCSSWCTSLCSDSGPDAARQRGQFAVEPLGLLEVRYVTRRRRTRTPRRCHTSRGRAPPSRAARPCPGGRA